MYTSFSLRNYRCFTDMTIAPLARINLIAGKNNMGKTALLEALWLHHGYYNPTLGPTVNAFRGITHFKRTEFLWDLFSGFDPESTIELSSRDLENRPRSLRITVQEHPTSHVSLRNGKWERGNGNKLSVTEMVSQETTEPIESEVRFDYVGPSGKSLQAHAFVESDNIRFERPRSVKEPTGIFLATRRRDDPEILAERFGNLAVAKEEDKIIRILQIIEPRLKSLTIQHRGGVPILHGEIGMRRLMPLSLMGDGVGRLLGIALAIPEAQDGILLVDEIENGMHYTVLNDVWKVLAGLAREYAVQLFATTHSEECIRAAHRAFSAGEQYDFALHRLERVDDTIRAITFDQRSLEAAIEMDAEVR
ncbi:MAG: AAA family ATPase [Chloroflexi bacterium]|nr:AAA family ATPase [Chloroflexota bacterium]